MNLKHLFELDWVKTVRFNLHYFGWKRGLILPVFIYRKTHFEQMGGDIKILSPLKTGMIKIGQRTIGVQNPNNQTIIQFMGGVIFKGQADIGRGCKLCVGKNGILEIGEKFRVTGDSTIICMCSVCIGNNSLLSWDILIMDTDFHKIIVNNQQKNRPKPIYIGNHVWVGCRCTILKGSSIEDDIVVAANSNVCGKLSENGCVYGGSGRDIAILQKNIQWNK